MPKLFALLVAVGEYPNPRHCLKGCANDLVTMHRLLKKQAEQHGMEYLPELLADKQATRAALIQGFDHFKAAGKDDYCLFYFSGHGSFVPVPNAFYNDASGRNESLVCHDSRTPGGRDLMDKELAYLAHRSMINGQPTFISVLDCCHSGSAFRSLEESTEEEILDRQTPAAGSVPIEEYLGYADYAIISGQKLPPRYPAMHLAACRPDERAQERPIDGIRQGVFTYCLSRELSQANPNLSVEELMRRVNIRANTVNPKQFPYLDDDGVNRSGQPLFGGSSTDASAGLPKATFRVHFRDGNWFVDAGSLQNIQPGTPDHPTLFKEEDGHEWRVTRTEPHRSQVTSDRTELDHGQLYSVTLESNGRERLKVALHPELPPQWQEVLTAIAPEFPELELLSGSAEGCGYRIDKLQSTVVLVRPAQGVPLFKRVDVYDEEDRPDSMRTFLEQISQVAAWEAVLKLANPQTRIPDSDIQIEMTINDGSANERTVTDFSDPVPLYYHQDNGLEVPPTFQIKVTNISSRTYWLSGLQSSSAFGISNELMRWQELAAGSSFNLGYLEADGSIDPHIENFLDDEYRSWGVTEILDHYKLVISNHPEINTDNFNQDPLELDSKDNFRSDGDERGSRRAKPRQDSRDWTVKNFSLRTIRPLESIAIGEYEEDLKGISITGVKGFSAQAKLTSMETGSRSLQQALPPAFSGAELISLSGISGERDLSEELNAIELTDISQPGKVSAETPLRLRMGTELADNESIIPFGYDEESGAYYPLGYLDENGDILIQDIPKEIADERSLGGSVKILFQKIVGKWVGMESEYPLLRQVVEEVPGGQLVYADKDLDAIAENIATSSVKKVVLFVHGIIGDTESSTAILQQLAQKTGENFTDRYQVVLTFDYENLGTNIDATAKEMFKKLTKLGFGTNGKKLHIYAHSMGGLVSRWMIEKEGGKDIVDQLYTFGTPHGGSPWSNVFGLLTSAITYGISGATLAQPWMIALLGFERFWKKSQTTLVEMGPKSDFIKRLNDNSEAPIPYTLIAGNTQLVKTEQEAKLRGFVERLLYRFRHHPHYALLDAGMFRGPNDIAVSLESQQLVKGDLVSKPDPIACDHLSYFNNPFCVELVEELTRG